MMGKLQTWMIAMILMVSIVASSTVRAQMEQDATVPEAIEIPENQTGDYKIGLEDVLEIVVWRNVELSRAVKVRPDGKISLPLIGDVQAAGLTTTALREAIRERLKEFQKVPEVSVIVQEINSNNIYILGNVAAPGKYPLAGHITVLQALGMAGGLTTTLSSRDSIMILRKQSHGMKEKVIKFRYMDFLITEDTSKNIILKRGDTIIVP